MRIGIMRNGVDRMGSLRLTNAFSAQQNHKS
jgi:hypothetical protein